MDDNHSLVERSYLGIATLGPLVCEVECGTSKGNKSLESVNDDFTEVI